MATRTDSVGRAWVHTPLAQLLRKDLAVFIPRDRWLFSLIFLLATVQTFLHDEAFFWLCVALAGALVAVVPVIEWRLETDRLLGSLPVSPPAIVKARYISAALTGLFAALAWTVTGRLLAPVLAPDRAMPGMWTTLEGVLTFLLVVGVLVALFLPLHFRFGLGRGAGFFSIACVALLALASLLPGSGAPVGPQAGAVTDLRAIIAPPSQPVRSAVAQVLESLGPVGAIGTLVGGVTAIWLLSIGVSVHWFQRRDL
jgi:hypothetical protein